MCWHVLWFNSSSITFSNSLWTYLERETTVTNSAGITFNFNIPQGKSHDLKMLTRCIVISGYETIAEKWNFKKSSRHDCVTEILPFQNCHVIYYFPVFKGPTSRWARPEKIDLNLSSCFFAIRVNLLYHLSSIFWFIIISWVLFYFI